MLSLSILRDIHFYEELEVIKLAKLSAIKFENQRLIVRELLNIANGDVVGVLESLGATTNSLSQYLQTKLQTETETFRII